MGMVHSRAVVVLNLKPHSFLQVYTTTGKLFRTAKCHGRSRRNCVDLFSNCILVDAYLYKRLSHGSRSINQPRLLAA